LRPRQGAHARSKKCFLPVSHFLHQNETTAGSKMKFSLKINSPQYTVFFTLSHTYRSRNVSIQPQNNSAIDLSMIFIYFVLTTGKYKLIDQNDFLPVMKHAL
jgi:hypothetical protein